MPYEITSLRTTYNKDDDFRKDFPKDFPKEIFCVLSKRQQLILHLIHNDCTLTSQKISEKISEKESVSQRTIKKDIFILKEMGILAREGGRKDGHWVIIKK
ncbi:MAG: HTH domain-containing protein [Bacteroidales bacterium]|nr:HTH domain-containing protein [Candidatus Colimorpha onthohippi]